MIATVQLVLGRVCGRRREWTEAARLHHEALAAITEHGLRLELSLAREALAEVAAGLESDLEAARNLGVAGRLRRDDGRVPWPAQRAEVEALPEWLRES